MLHLVNSWLLGFTLWGRAEAILANEYVQRAQPQLQVFNAAQLQLALRHQVFRFGMPWWAYWYGQFPSFSPVPFVRFGHHFLKSDRTANHQRTQPNPTHEIAIPIFHSWDPSFFYNKKNTHPVGKKSPKKKTAEGPFARFPSNSLRSAGRVRTWVGPEGMRIGGCKVTKT